MLVMPAIVSSECPWALCGVWKISWELSNSMDCGLEVYQFCASHVFFTYGAEYHERMKPANIWLKAPMWKGAAAVLCGDMMAVLLSTSFASRTVRHGRPRVLKEHVFLRFHLKFRGWFRLFYGWFLYFGIRNIWKTDRWYSIHIENRSHIIFTNPCDFPLSTEHTRAPLA